MCVCIRQPGRFRSISRTHTYMFLIDANGSLPLPGSSFRAVFGVTGIHADGMSVASHFRQSHCLHVHVFLDDWLFRHQDREILLVLLPEIVMLTDIGPFSRDRSLFLRGNCSPSWDFSISSLCHSIWEDYSHAPLSALASGYSEE